MPTAFGADVAQIYLDFDGNNQSWKISEIKQFELRRK